MIMEYYFIIHHTKIGLSVISKVHISFNNVEIVFFIKHPAKRK